MMGMMVSERGTASGYRHWAWCYIPNPNPNLVPSFQKPSEMSPHSLG